MSAESTQSSSADRPGNDDHVGDDITTSFESALDDVVAFIKQRRRDLSEHTSQDSSHKDPLPIHGTRTDRDRALLALPSSLPTHGLGTLPTTRLLLSSILPGCLTAQPSSRYFGFVTGGVTASSQLADTLVTSLDENVQVTLPDVTISTALEAKTLEMVLDLLGIENKVFEGRTLTTGATASNVLGMAVGRDAIIARRAVRTGDIGSRSYEHGIAEDGFPPHVLGVPYRDTDMDVDLATAATTDDSASPVSSVWHPPILILTSRIAAHGSILKAAALTGVGRRNVVGVPPPPASMRSRGKALAQHGTTSITTTSLRSKADQSSAELVDLPRTDEVGTVVAIDTVTDEPDAAGASSSKQQQDGSDAGVVNADDDEDDPLGLGMDTKILERRLNHAKSIGQGVIVVITLGEVNTGGITPGVERVADLCRKYDAWLHVDAAFGGFGAILPELASSKIRESMEVADSLTLDAHKWLNVPYDCAMFYTRHLADLVRTTGPSPSTGMPAYLRPSAATNDGDDSDSDPRLAELRQWAAAVPSPLNVGIENSRRFRALPLFASLMELGKEGYVDVVRRNCAFANAVGQWMLDASLGGKYYELVNRLPSNSAGDVVVPLNVVLFRALENAPFGAKDGGNAALLARLNATRVVYFTGTVWAGQPAIRMAVSNARTARYVDRDTGRPIERKEGGENSDSWLAVTSTLLAVMKGAELERGSKQAQ